ncbi:hypothetical protein E3K09_09995 [Salmonella enterica]|nr:hypothetical protein [Salmonella enterica]
MMAATNWTPERAGGVANAFCAGLLTGGGELQPNSGNEPGIVFTPMVESEIKNFKCLHLATLFLMDNLNSTAGGNPGFFVPENNKSVFLIKIYLSTS